MSPQPGLLRPLTILADDLSGSLDTAVKLLPHLFSRVYPRLGDCPDPWPDGVFVYNLDSRHHPVEASIKLTLKALSRLRPHSLYLKVDSTLRGNVGSTIETILTHTAYQSALVCPAFPDNRRTVVGGQLYVGDRPVEHSPVASDPKNPMLTSSISTILHGQSDLPTKKIRLDQVRRGSLRLEQSVPPMIYVVDAVTSEDLRRIAGLLQTRPDILPVGAAALAEALFAPRSQDFTQSPSPSIPKFRRIVAFVGSMHPQSQRQRQSVARDPNWQVWTVNDGGELPSTHPDYHLLVATPSLPQPGHEPHLATIARTLGSRLGRPAQDNLWFATGGDTALALVLGLGLSWLSPVRELAPGVVLSYGPAQGSHIWLVTKSGAFGADTLLNDLARHFTAT